MYDSVLLPTDGSEHSVRASKHGVLLARAFDATAHIVNVVDVSAAAGPFDAGGVGKEFVDRLEDEGERAMEAVEDAVGGYDHPVRTEILHGEPSEEILAYAKENGIDLIAMGTHGTKGVSRYITGSVARRVIRLADAPVLTARATEGGRSPESYGDVLVPTDGSEAAAEAVAHGVAVAERFGARLHAVNVVNAEGVVASLSRALGSELRERLEAEGEKAVKEIAAEAQEAGVETATEVGEGQPSETLLGYAEKHGIDMIAMATTGRTGIGEHLLGSTAERVIRRSDAPVLAVSAGNR